VEVEADKVVDAPVAMEGQEPAVGDPVAAVREVAWDPAVVVAADQVQAADPVAVDQALVAAGDPVAADQALVAVGDPVAAPEEEVAGEPARCPSSSPIKQWYSTFPGSIRCAHRPCGLIQIDSIWLNVAAGLRVVAKEAVTPVGEDQAVADKVAAVWVAEAGPVGVEVVADKVAVEWVAVAGPVGGKAVADKVAAVWVAEAGPVGVEVVADKVAVEWVAEAGLVGAMARVEVVLAAVGLALEVEEPWEVEALQAVAVRVDREKWSPGLQGPPARSPGI
jgi:hypothetical protein